MALYWSEYGIHFIHVLFLLKVHFQHGRIVPENTLLVDFESEHGGHMGSLVNNSFLANARLIWRLRIGVIL